jgi:ParB/Sulfiredoxin domain
VSDVEPGFESHSEANYDLPAPIREGLPKSYAMRADPHYVEELSGASDTPSLRYLPVTDIDVSDAGDASAPPELVQCVRAFGVLQPLLVRGERGRYHLIAGRERLRAALAAGLSAVPCLVHRIGADEAVVLAHAEATQATPPPLGREAVSGSESDRLVPALAEQIRLIDAAERLLSETPGSLGQRAARDLVAAHTRRAAWLVEAVRLLAEADKPVRPREPLGATVTQVAARLQPECRLSGIDIRVHLDDQAYAARLGGHLLAVGLTGAVVALAPWDQEKTNPEALVIAVTRSNGTIAIEVRRAQARVDAGSLGARTFAAAVEAVGGEATTTAQSERVCLKAVFSEDWSRRSDAKVSTPRNP